MQLFEDKADKESRRCGGSWRASGGELCIVVKWLDAPAAGTTNKRKIVGETQSLTLEQWKGDYKARRA